MQNIFGLSSSELSNIMDVSLVHAEEEYKFYSCPVLNPIWDFRAHPLNISIPIPGPNLLAVSRLPYLRTRALVEHISKSSPQSSWYLCRRTHTYNGPTDYYNLIFAPALEQIFPLDLIKNSEITPNDFKFTGRIWLGCPISCKDLSEYLRNIIARGRFKIIDSQVFLCYCLAMGNNDQNKFFDDHMAIE